MKMRNYDSFMRRLDAVERALDDRDAKALDGIERSAPVVRPDNHFMVEELAKVLAGFLGGSSAALHSIDLARARLILAEWSNIKRRARQRETSEGRQ